MESESLEHSGSEVLDEHVGFIDEVFDELEIVRVLEVSGDRLLVPIDEFPPLPFAVARIAPSHSTQ